MSSASHPLSDVFSEYDLERLRNGKCVESENAADDTVVRIVTGDCGGPNDYAVSLGEWVRQAARHGDEIRCHYRTQLRNTVSDRCAFLQPASELMASYFLEIQQGFSLRYVPRQAVRTPDFEIRKDSLSLMVEVKTPDSDAPPPSGGRPVMAVPSAAPLLRKAMDSARGQLERNENNLILVVTYQDCPIWEDEAEDAAYGDPCLKIPYMNGSPGEPYEVREENVFFQPCKNTRIGALGVLGWTRRAESTGYFIHNAYARNRVPNWAFDPWPQYVVDEPNGVMVWRNREKKR